MVKFTKSYAPEKVSHFLSILPRKKRLKTAFFHFYYVKVPLQKCVQLLQKKFKILFVLINAVAKTITYHYIIWYNLEVKYFLCLMVSKNAKKTCHNTTPLPTRYQQVVLIAPAGTVLLKSKVPQKLQMKYFDQLISAFNSEEST